MNTYNPASTSTSQESLPRNPISSFVLKINQALGQLTPIVDLLVRFWVAKVFFASGLTKTTTASFSLFGSDWSYPTSLLATDTTMMLFQYEYSVPLLPYTLAAHLATLAELILPVFLLLGLAGRYSALALFVFNIVAVVSYEAVQSGAGLQQHLVWGLLLLVTISHGPGKLSLDYWLAKKSG